MATVIDSDISHSLKSPSTIYYYAFFYLNERTRIHTDTQSLIYHDSYVYRSLCKIHFSTAIFRKYIRSDDKRKSILISFTFISISFPFLSHSNGFYFRGESKFKIAFPFEYPISLVCRSLLSELFWSTSSIVQSVQSIFPA